VVLPAWSVSAVVEAPRGAYPSYAHGYYPRDNAFYVGWDAIARDRDSFQAWMRDNVLRQAISSQPSAVSTGTSNNAS
jgi:glutaconate CoA-transferase subunit A